MEAGIKGVNCNTTLAFARERLGARWPELVESLPEQAKRHALRRILSVEWVPLKDWYPIEEAIFDRICGRREEDYWSLTKDIVASEFNGLYRAFLKVPGPAFVLDKAARIFATYFNAGGIQVVARVVAPTQANPCVVEAQLPGRYPLFITSFAAGFDAVLGLTRAKNLRVSIASQRVDEAGVFGRYFITWES